MTDFLTAFTLSRPDRSHPAAVDSTGHLRGLNGFYTKTLYRGTTISSRPASVGSFYPPCRRDPSSDEYKSPSKSNSTPFLRLFLCVTSGVCGGIAVQLISFSRSLSSYPLSQWSSSSHISYIARFRARRREMANRARMVTAIHSAADEVRNGTQVFHMA